MMNLLDVTNEEMFCYELSRGSTKTVAYRAIRDCTSMSDATVRVLAFRYSNQPHIRVMMSEIDDNTFMEYIRKRQLVLEELSGIALSSEESARSKIDASATYLTHTAKATRIDVKVNHEVNASTLLEELRATLLEPPIDNPTGLETPSEKIINISKSRNKTPSTNIIENSESFQDDNTTSNDTIYIEKGITIDGEVVSSELIEEQIEGLNPLTPNKGVMGNDKGVTGRFRAEGGRFIKNSEALDRLEQGESENH